MGRANKDFYLLDVTKKQANESKWQMISHGQPRLHCILQMQLATAAATGGCWRLSPPHCLLKANDNISEAELPAASSLGSKYKAEHVAH